MQIAVTTKLSKKKIGLHTKHKLILKWCKYWSDNWHDQPFSKLVGQINVEIAETPKQKKTV